MEHKIGEIILLPNNISVKVIKVNKHSTDCKDCVFLNNGCIENKDKGIRGECYYLYRHDHHSIVYKQM